LGAASEPKPQVTLEASKQAVSISTCLLSNRSAAVGPPAVSPESTAYAAKSAANIMMADSRNSQKPYAATARVGAGPRSESGTASPPASACSAALIPRPPLVHGA